MKLEIPNNRRLYFIIMAIIFVGGFIFWISDLSSDPPMYYSGLGQSLSTDPSQYFFHARNKLIFDEFDPFDYSRWTVYQHSITSLVNYFWLSIVGVSITKANAVGVFFCFGALIFFILGMLRHHSPWVAAALSLCFVLNVSLLTYGRLTYLENGLIFLSSLLFYVYSYWGDKQWGVILSGFIISLAMLTGKFFGVLLLPAFLLALFFANQKDRWKNISIGTGSFLLSSLIITLVLYGTNFSAAFGYVTEQSYGLRGFPAGLSSPLAFFEHLISFGFANRLFYLDPDIFMFIIASGIFLIYLNAKGMKLSDLSRPTMLSILWVVITFTGLMPLNYSPVRYTLFMLPPVIIAAFLLTDTLYHKKLKNIPTFTKLHLASLGVLLWFASFQIIGNFFFFNTQPQPIATLTWMSLPIAIGLTVIIKTLFEKEYIKFNKRLVTLSLIIMLAMSVTSNSFRIRRLHILDNNYNIIEANLDIEQILGENAVVSGPYGSVLTANTKVKSFIHLFGVANVDSTLFDRYPITHVAVDASNWNLAQKDYPQLQQLQPVTSYWIRDYEVQLYNISKLFSNKTANAYEETDYEKGLASFYENETETALEFAHQFYNDHPESKSGNILLIDLLSGQQKFDDVYRLLIDLAARYPTDFFLQLQCGRFLQIMSFSLNDQSLYLQAQKYYEKAVEVNRFKGTYAYNMFTHTARQLNGNGNLTP